MPATDVFSIRRVWVPDRAPRPSPGQPNPHVSVPTRTVYRVGVGALAGVRWVATRAAATTAPSTPTTAAVVARTDIDTACPN